MKSVFMPPLGGVVKTAKHCRSFGSGLLFCCFLALSTFSFGQSISGVINDYMTVTSISSVSATVSSNSLSPGDQVLVIQMMGAQAIGSVNNTTYGDIISMNGAGHYEFNHIQSVSGNTVTFSKPLCHTYAPEDSVQLIRVPVYEGDVTVTDTLTSLPWNGSSGGVLVFEVKGTLILNSDIDVSKKGFKGGDAYSGYQAFQPDFYCTYGFPGPGPGNMGGKGHGVAKLIPMQECGQGSLCQWRRRIRCCQHRRWRRR